MLYLVGMARAHESEARLPRVPRGTPDLIAYLTGSGVKIRELAAAWSITSDAVYRLRRGEFIPNAKTTAQLIAKSVGWGVGEVVEHFAAKVQR